MGLVSNGWVVGGVNNSYCFSNVQREKSDRSFSMISFGRSDRFSCSYKRLFFGSYHISRVFFKKRITLREVVVVIDISKIPILEREYKVLRTLSGEV